MRQGLAVRVRQGTQPVRAPLPRPGAAAYPASKHAIAGLAKSIALDGRAGVVAALTATTMAGVACAPGGASVQNTNRWSFVYRNLTTIDLYFDVCVFLCCILEPSSRNTRWYDFEDDICEYNTKTRQTSSHKYDGYDIR